MRERVVMLLILQSPVSSSALVLEKRLFSFLLAFFLQGRTQFFQRFQPPKPNTRQSCPGGLLGARACVQPRQVFL